MYSPNDFNFGSGASNPTGTYLQTGKPAQSWAPKNWWETNKVGGAGGLGFNLDTAGLALGGLQTIGSLWNAFEARKQAGEQFAFAKDFANTNLANQIKSYNTILQDQSRARAFTEGQTAEQAAAYVAENRLPDRKIA
jgi:hypothetical protein